jgi:hypothetical protein
MLFLFYPNGSTGTQRRWPARRTNLARSLAVLSVALLFLCPTSWAAPIFLTIHTPALHGITGQLAFNLIDGGGPSNSVTIAGFSSDGSLGSVQSVGSVTGELPAAVNLSDGQFFSEYLQDFVFGTAFSFTVNATAHPAGGTGFPDGFSLFLLDPVSGQSLITSSDPTGANALLLLSIGSSPQLVLYQATGVEITVDVAAIPEPGTLPLMVVGLLAAALLVCRRRRSVRDNVVSATINVVFIPSIWQRNASVCVLGMIGSFLATHACATDVTATTHISRSALVLNRSTATFDSVVTLTNTGQQSYASPLRLIVQVNPSVVSLSNGTGVTTDGKAFIDIPLPTGNLNQGQSVRTTVKINNVPRIPFTVQFFADAAVAEPPGLPPDPGPGGEIPLLGVDSDRDGVRDDVQRYIALTYRTDANTVKALRELSKTYQAMLVIPIGNAAEAKAINIKAWRNRSCLVFLYGAVEGHRRAQELFALQFNTLARYRMWSRQDDLLAGEVFESPPKSAANCDFAITAR